MRRNLEGVVEVATKCRKIISIVVTAGLRPDEEQDASRRVFPPQNNVGVQRLPVEIGTSCIRKRHEARRTDKLAEVLVMSLREKHLPVHLQRQVAREGHRALQPDIVLLRAARSEERRV